MVIWIIGLSGAGKTAVGKELTKKLGQMGRPVVFFDGDIFREMMGNDLGHSVEDRKKNADRICRFCQKLDEQGVDVVFGILSVFHESQEWNRKNISRYYEIYLEVSLETVTARDAKGLYQKASSGEIKNVVGVDVRFEAPKHPDLVINNDQETENFDGMIKVIVQDIKSKGFLEDKKASHV